jgi:MFS family permease
VPSPTLDAAGSPAAVHRAYRDLGVVGYILYGVGAISPFLRDSLGLSDAQTGFHSSLVALGLLTAGLIADRADRRAGPSQVHSLAAVLGMAATLLLAWAPAFAVTLLASMLIGLTAGIFLGHVNGLLGTGGGPEARLHLVRANVFGIAGPFVVPIVIALGIALGVGWKLVLVPSLALLALTLRDALRHGIPLADRIAAAPTGGRLPRAYWVGWIRLATVVGVEFAVVFWAATLVQRGSGVSVGEATLAAGAFYLGMLLGRIALSVPSLGERPPAGLIRGGLLLALAGSLVAWWASDVWLGAAALLLAGVGVAGEYPLNVALALAAGRDAPGPATARLTLASGSAILVAPLVLGALADAVGLGLAWMVVPALCVVGLALSLTIRPSASDTVAAGVPAGAG